MRGEPATFIFVPHSRSLGAKRTHDADRRYNARPFRPVDRGPPSENPRATSPIRRPTRKSCTGCCSRATFSSSRATSASRRRSSISHSLPGRTRRSISAMRCRPRRMAPERHRLIEANLGEGCVAAPLSKYRTYNTRICRPRGLTPEDRETVVSFMTQRIGLKYDLKNVIDMLRYFLPTPPVPVRWRRRMIAFGSGDPTRAICSTMIAEAYGSIRYRSCRRSRGRRGAPPRSRPIHARKSCTSATTRCTRRAISTCRPISKWSSPRWNTGSTTRLWSGRTTVRSRGRVPPSPDQPPRTASRIAARSTSRPSFFSDEVESTAGKAAGRLRMRSSVSSISRSTADGLILSALVRTIW